MSIGEVRIKSWEEFERAVTELDLDAQNREFRFRSRKVGCKLEGKTPFPTIPLFRGQSDEAWTLLTTLERALGHSDVKVIDYYRLLSRVKPAIESITNNTWDLDYDYGLEGGLFLRLQAYDFVVYLRQYGFPSPLLDWTRSPYVAAYFAYAGAKADNDVAVYCYIQDYHHSARSGIVGHYETKLGGYYVTSAPRHFAQQSNYTYCLKQNDKNEWQFANAEKGLTAGNSNENDLLVKYILPIGEKDIVLRKLDLMNVNAYSLFGTEEGLLQDLFHRENYLTLAPSISTRLRS